ncbi:MAG: HAD-IA family hydrolase [Ahrensia sp.]|nr:HAD-IA family hydrolase [Ahrensia sp.]
MTKIDHIVFDVGQVLLRWDHSLVYRDLIPDKAERDAFLEIMTPWNAEQDRGARSWEQAEAELIALHPDKADWIRAYRRDWLKSVPEAFEETVAVVRSLIADGRDVTLLTNFNDETWVLANQAYPFLTEPRGATVSGQIKCIKPEPEIYEKHVATFGLKPENTLFFDDSAKNVEGARDAAWHAERYEGQWGGGAFRDLLGKYGVTN